MSRRGTGQPQDDEFDKLAGEYLRRAGAVYTDALRRFDQGRYPDVVSAVQESLELSVKAVFRVAGVDPPTRHQIDDRRFREELRRVRKAIGTWDPAEDEWQTCRVGRLFFVASFWAQAYTAAKYGSDVLELGASELFGRQEAALALNHLGEVVTSLTGPFLKSRGAPEIQLPEVR